jgi:foldase protein PrsA
MLRRAALVLLAALSVLAFAACGSARPAAATVDGETITQQQLGEDMVLYRFLAGLSQQPCGQADTASGETDRAACARFTLSNLIQEDLVKHYAAAHDVSVSDSSVSSAISNLEQSLGGAGQLDTQLKASGVTRPQLVNLARRLLLFGEVQRSIAASRVSDAQVRQLYEQQKAQYTQIHAKHILVKTRAEAERIARQATPENFGRLAERYSTDTTSAKNGGDLGTLSASGLDADFVKAAEALKPGEISGPVQTQFGWHVIELVSVDVPPLSQVRDQLVAPLQGQVFNQWLQQRLRSATISVNPKYGRFDEGTGQVLAVHSTADLTTGPSPSGSPVGSSPSP